MTIENDKLSLDFKLNENTQSIGELWESLEKIVSGRAVDNKLSGYYPLNARERQFASLEALVDCIKETHEKMYESLHSTDSSIQEG